MYDDGVPMHRIGQPREVSNAVLWLLSEQSSYVTGGFIPVDGGMSAMIPTLLHTQHKEQFHGQAGQDDLPCSNERGHPADGRIPAPAGIPAPSTST
jgi:hypothetical protein